MPKQQSPGTNNPDVGKQRRPTPNDTEKGTPNDNKADVPDQQPGTNNPDVGKQRRSDTTPSHDSGQKGSGSQKHSKPQND